jgi:hypothetical protein
MNIEKISADNAFRNDLNNALKKFVGQLSSLENVEATFHSRRENIDKAIRQIISDDGSRIVANIANLKILLTGLKQYIEAMKR